MSSFIDIFGKYNYLRMKNFKIFVSFVGHDSPVSVINCYQNGSLLSSIIGKQYQFALATGIYYPAKPAR